MTNCGQKEVDAAVEAATCMFYEGEWSQLGGYERGRLLNKLADLIEANQEELAMLECLDNGKTYGEALGADLSLTIQCYRYYAGWADKIHGKVINPSGPMAKGTSFCHYLLNSQISFEQGCTAHWNTNLSELLARSSPGMLCRFPRTFKLFFN